MSQAIKSNELFEPGISKDFRADIQLSTEAAKVFSDSLTIVIKNQKILAQNTKNNAKGYLELAAAEKQAAQALVSKMKIDKELNKVTQANLKLVQAEIKAEDQLNKAIITEEKLKQQKIRTERMLQQEREKARKAAEKEEKQTKLNGSAYHQLQTKIKTLTATYRDLVASEKGETIQARALRQEILQLNAVRDKANRNLGMHQDKVGQYERALGGLTRTLGALGLSFGVFTLLSSSLGIITDYEKATQSMSAITGAVGQDLEDLKGKVIDTADAMGVSITETTKLFEIVGSQMPQLLKDSAGLQQVAEAAIILSKASGDTIENSTLAMASAMNQFSLGADQAERVMNVLAAGSLVGSAGVVDVSEAMKNFGSVAAGANISLEQSVALIEVLGKFGVIGAEAGTKLRGSILKLQQAGMGYASGQFVINDALEEARTKMESYGSAMEQDAFLQKTFGAENISTGRILLSNIDLMNQYTAGVTGTSVATDQAAINSNTMTMAVKGLKAGWENLIIKWSESTSTLGLLKGTIKFVTNNLETIIKVVWGAIRAWLAFTIQQKLWRYELDKNMKLVRAGLIPSLIASTKAMMASAKAFRMGTISAKAFGDTLKKIPFLAILSAVGTLVSLFWSTEEAVDATAEGMGDLEEEALGLTNVNKKLTAEMAKEEAQLTAVFDALAATKHGTDERKKGIKELSATYGIYLKDLKNDIEFNRQLSEALAVVIKNMEMKIRVRLVEEEINALLEKRILLENKLDPINEERRNRLLQQQVQLRQQIKDLEAQGFVPGIPDATGNIQTKADQLKDLRDQLAALDLQIKSGGGQDINFNIDEEGFNSIPDINARIEELKKSMGGLTPFSFVEREFAGGEGDAENKKKTQLELDTDYFKRYQENNQNNLKVIENNAIKAGADQEELAIIMAEARLEILKSENEKALELFGEYSDEYVTANLALNKALAEQKQENFKTQLEIDRRYFEDLKQANEEGILNLENFLLKEGKNRTEIEEALRKQRLDNLKFENEEALRLFGEYSAEYMEANLALNRALLTEEEELLKKKEEMKKKAMESLEKSFQDLTKTLTEILETQTALIDRQIKNQEDIYGDSKDMENELRQIAEERGLNATESIEAERDAQKKAQLEIEKLEARKRELELTIAAMKLLSDGHSVADIKNNLSDIMSFAKNLPQFYEGTPYSVADELGHTNTRDGHFVRVDDNEGIVTGAQMRDLGVQKGKRSIQDVVNMVKNGILPQSLRLAIPNGGQMLPSINLNGTNEKLAGKLDQVISNTAPENQPRQVSHFNSIVGYFEYQYKSRLRKEKVRYNVKRGK